MDIAEEVYDTLIGERIIPITGVPNAFREGSACCDLYRQTAEACERLRERLGAEDEDLECILDAHTALQRYLCVEMFRQGAKFDRTKNWDVL